MGIKPQNRFRDYTEGGANVVFFVIAGLTGLLYSLSNGFWVTLLLISLGILGEYLIAYFNSHPKFKEDKL